MTTLEKYHYLERLTNRTYLSAVYKELKLTINIPVKIGEYVELFHNTPGGITGNKAGIIATELLYKIVKESQVADNKSVK